MMITESPFPIKGHSELVFTYRFCKAIPPICLSLDVPDMLLVSSTCFLYLVVFDYNTMILFVKHENTRKYNLHHQITSYNTMISAMVIVMILMMIDRELMALDHATSMSSCPV